MLKKTITFVDFDGNERTEDFYFNLSRAELTEMNMTVNGGLTTLLEKIIKAQDSAQLFTLFKDLILRSYGEKTNDGRRFDKSQEIRDNFEHTGAYDVLLMELVSDDEKASDFVNSIIPAKAISEINDSAASELTVTK